MIKISLIYIGIVVAIAALITGVPMLVWTDETADKVEQVANLPIAKLIAPDAGAGAGAGRGASGFGSAEAGGSETSAPVAPLPSGVEAATAALLQGLSAPAPAPTPAPPASEPVAADGLAAAVAAAVAATEAPAAAPSAQPVPEPVPEPVPVGDDLTALIGATGAAQEELASMSGAALTGLRALRGAAAQGASLEDLVARAAQAGAQDDYIKALQDEAKR